MIRLMLRSLSQWLVPTLLFAGSLWFVLSATEMSKLIESWRLQADIGTLALAMTAIMLTGGIDLSVGSIVALSGMALGIAYRDYHFSASAAVGVALVTGTLAGSVNGALVAIGITPLVATLATMALFRGLAMAALDGERVAELPAQLTEMIWGNWWGLPPQVILLLVVALGYFVLVHHTWVGRSLFAIGENRLAAQFAAVPVRRIEALLYLLSGFVAGLIAVTQTASTGAAVPDAARGFELQAIACVVLGGTRVTGGFGSIARTLFGIATLINLRIGFNLYGRASVDIPGLGEVRLSADNRLIIIGALVILVAVINERLASRRRS